MRGIAAPFFIIICSILTPFFAFANPTTTAPIPDWAHCSEGEECQAIRGICQNWEYVNKKLADSRSQELAKRRTITKCLQETDPMQNPPAAACLYEICAPKLLEKKNPEYSRFFHEYLERVHLMLNTCEEHSDCERGLATCGNGCEYYEYPKAAKEILGKWVQHYSDLGPACKKACVDPYYRQVNYYAIRCVQKHCVLTRVRDKF